jgi:hypothetical protein
VRAIPARPPPTTSRYSRTSARGLPFYDHPGVSGERYRAWLQTNAVRFVALPDVTLDPAGRGEARLIAAHPADLRPVWHSRHWHVFEVLHAAPLVQGPATLVALGPDRLTLRADRPARVRIALHWSPLWHVSGGGACIMRTPDDFIGLRAARAGTVRLTTRVTLAGVLGATSTCAAQASAEPTVSRFGKTLPRSIASSAAAAGRPKASAVSSSIP